MKIIPLIYGFYRGAGDKLPPWEKALIVSLVCIAAATAFYLLWRKERYWERAFFRPI